ncbi:hypothetical protein BC937DRAFT_88969 [Endogone sp. FLAS-F59071]|nr:hypothetical protein BC937DRAFT_88969 [Endogone sp. FLAS-F59071]|eukprot:RUS18279.1 hypothetical protein BC937DRAFT_88969 [Endogone sp. FLAS-F59071]
MIKPNHLFVLQPVGNTKPYTAKPNTNEPNPCPEQTVNINVHRGNTWWVLWEGTPGISERMYPLLVSVLLGRPDQKCKHGNDAKQARSNEEDEVGHGLGGSGGNRVQNERTEDSCEGVEERDSTKNFSCLCWWDDISYERAHRWAEDRANGAHKGS